MNRDNYMATTHHIITKSVIIYILNCTDILFTYTFLKTGTFYEFNLLMQNIVSNPYLSILVKIICPACLIIYLIHTLKTHYTTHIRLCNLTITLLLLVYLSVNLLHLYYTLRRLRNAVTRINTGYFFV